MFEKKGCEMYMLSTYNESADLGFMYMAEQTSPEENSVSNLHSVSLIQFCIHFVQ